MKTYKIRLDNIKSPDSWGELIYNLKLKKNIEEKYFEWSGYASIEIEVDKDLNIINGRILKLNE